MFDPARHLERSPPEIPMLRIAALRFDDGLRPLLRMTRADAVETRRANGNAVRISRGICHLRINCRYRQCRFLKNVEENADGIERGEDCHVIVGRVTADLISVRRLTDRCDIARIYYVSNMSLTDSFRYFFASVTDLF